MKTNLDKFIEDICTGFQEKHGRAFCYAFPPIDIVKLVYNIYTLFAKKNPKEQIFIVVDCYNTRKKIVDYFISKNLTYANGYDYKVLSADYIKAKYIYRYKLIISVGVNDDINTIKTLSFHSKFILSILTKNIMDHEFITELRSFLPEITSTISENDIKNDNIHSPVEIYQLAIELNEDDKNLYDKYTEYITISLQIFGDFDTIEKARIGDARINLSSSEVRDTIAKNNGWSTTLDTMIPFNKQIDDIYNPNALYERANNVYNIMRQRRDLVCNNKEKLATITRICYENKNKRILIVSKSGEFALEVTKYINSVSTEEDSLSCLDYHNHIESTAMLTDDGKDYIRYKTGKQKGEIKIFGAQAISNYNLALFNANAVNCLSIKNASDQKLKTAIDLIIYTSPICDDIIDFKKRFTNVTFTTVPNKVYVVYCDNTLENDKLYSNKRNNLFTVVEDNEKDVVYNENTNDIIW